MKAPTPKKAPAIAAEPNWLAPVGLATLLFGVLVFFRAVVFGGEAILSGDFLQAGYFFRAWLREHVTLGDVSAHWNPYIFGGMPYIESFFGDIFYPVSVIMRQAGDLWHALSLNLVLHVVLAGLFMYLCARQFKLSVAASLFAAAAYMYAPYLVSLVSPWHDGKMFVTAWFPLAIMSADRIFTGRWWQGGAMLGLVIGFIMLTPHIQMAYYALWATGAFVLFRLIQRVRQQNVLSAIFPALGGVMGVVLGLGLAAMQFLPGYIYTKEFSPRADTKKGWEWSTSWSMHAEEAFSLVIPEFSGTSSENTQTYYWGKNAFKDNSESTTVVAFAIAILGIFCWRRPESWFLLGMALVTLIYALGASTPFYGLFFNFIPNVKSLRAPSMIMYLFSFSMALLAAMGIERLLSRNSEKENSLLSRLLLIIPAAYFVLALLFTVAGKGMIDFWTSIFYSDISSVQLQQGMTKLDVAYANLPAISGGAWIAFFLVAVAFGLLWLLRKSANPSLIAGALCLLPMVDGLRFNGRFLMTRESSSYQTIDAPTQALSRITGNDRAIDFRSNRSTAESNLPHAGIAIPAGYHGNQLRWYDDLLGGIGMPEIQNPHLLNLCGVKYLLLPSGQQLPADYFGPQPVTVVQRVGNADIALNPNALPRVFLADSYEVIQNRADIYPRVRSGQDDLRAKVLLEKEPGQLVQPLSPSDSAWFGSYDFDSITVGVNTNSPCLLVTTDNWFDAWQVTVDGKPAELLRAYGTFRAVAIPAGTKEVKYQFASPRFAQGVLFTWISGFLIVGLLAFGFVLDRKQKAVTTSS